MIKKLWILMLATFFAGDLFTTVVLSNLIGATHEANPLVRNWLQSYGGMGFLALKLFALTLVIPAIRILPKPLKQIQLGIGILFGVFGTVGNLYVLSLVL